MHPVILGSSSSGNATLLEVAGYHFLFDVGFSCMRIKKNLSSLGINLDSDIDAIFLTHEHTDHSKALPNILKNNQIPVYTRAKTIEKILTTKKNFPEELTQRFIPILDNEVCFGKVRVRPFSILHDVADPVGYTVSYQQEKFTLATDFGFVTSEVQSALENSTVLILEANYDVQKLKFGSYPWSLKRRTMSNHGHLSNEQAGYALLNLKSPLPKKIFLAHLSQENNSPELAKKTVQEILLSNGKSLQENQLIVAHSDEMTFE